ncbi:hypothetical protein IB227_12850 [Stenotrophomonas sp. STM01]|jgi:hypothetical protein|uniref:hypothetical protein n=1 Tax=Stenotrophomonas sp. STM01 TaxID=2769278 RepID=UPI001785A7BA|nr:hypothetical protein [Stenotrophomonas sp. STM01]MBD9536742.1 hypothetical protein [Stenotrophomonas sp. STM01]
MHIRLPEVAPFRYALPLAAFVLTVIGYFSQSIFDPMQVKPLKLLFHIALILNAIAALVWLLKRQIPLTIFVSVAWLAALVYFAGLGPSAAVLLLAASAVGLGTLVVPANRSSLAVVALCGLALITTVISWSLPFRIHHPWVYFLAGSIIVALRLQPIIDAAAKGNQEFQRILRTYPWAAFLVVNVVGACSTPLWLPTMQSDDIAYHLALPTQLQLLSYYRMDIDGSIWALSPWATDIVQAIPQVLTGTESRGPVNLVWMLCLYGGMWRLGRQLGLAPSLNLLTIALHASLPISSSMLAGMQTELPSSAVFINLLCQIGGRRVLNARTLSSIAILAGLLLAIKLSNALLLAPAALWLVARHHRQFPYRGLPAAVLLGAFVALPSFTYAAIVAGNPFLPFLNGYFESPYLPIKNWTDTSWQRDINLMLPWLLTFKTSDYLSATNGATGFIYIFCAAGLFPGLYFRRTRAVTLVAVGAFAAVFSQIQYVRYTQPATVALLIAAATGLQLLVRGSKPLAIGMTVLCALNVSVVGSGYWHLRHGALRMFIKDGPVATLDHFAPQRSIAAMLAASGESNMQVIFHNVDSQGNAELVIPTLTTSWYNPDVAAERSDADADPTGNTWAALMANHGTTHLVTNRNQITPGLKAALGTVGDGIIYRAGVYDVWRINSRTALTYETIHSGDDYIKLRYPSSVHPGLVAIDAQFSCSLPGEPIVISISSRSTMGGKDRNLLSRWAVCGPDMIAKGNMETSLTDQSQVILFTAVPRKPMHFELQHISTHLSANSPGASTDPATQLVQQITRSIGFDESK